MMKKALTTALMAIMLTAGAHCQSIDDILNTIADNNTGLKAMVKDAEAADAETRAANAVGGPSVEYSPFWASGVAGISSSELVASQEFDFPTLYRARARSADTGARVMELRYDEARRNLKFEAKTLCLRLVMLREENTLLQGRLSYAAAIISLLDRMEKAGATTALDINKARMEHMSLKGAVRLNEVEQIEVAESLVSLNGSLPLNLDTIAYPEATLAVGYEEFRKMAVDSDPAILAARGEIDAARLQVGLSRQSWLPSIRIGYRRNTAPGEAQNGFIVGMSFPVWSTSSLTRAAKARQWAAELRADEATRQLDNTLDTQYRALSKLSTTIEAYDRPLMDETLRLLAKAVEAGQITVLEYFTESALVYDKMQELIDARYEYHTVMASLTRSSL